MMKKSHLQMKVIFHEKTFFICRCHPWIKSKDGWHTWMRPISIQILLEEDVFDMQRVIRFSGDKKYVRISALDIKHS